MGGGRCYGFAARLSGSYTLVETVLEQAPFSRHVGADRFVELVSGDTALFGPVGDVGGHLRIDLFQVVGPFSRFLVYGVGLMDFGCIAVLGHRFFLRLALSC